MNPIIEITKAQLRDLQQHRGAKDTASGAVLVTFCGALDVKTGLYAGTLKWRAATEDDTRTFDLAATLGGGPRPIEIDDED